MNVVDLFAGGGGFSLGFRQAGFAIRGLVEIGYWESETLRLNFKGSQVISNDIRKLTGDDIIEKTGRPDVLIGGPPCEAFTTANKDRKGEPIMRLYDDPRGRLTLHFIKVLGELEPEIFVMENVPGIIEGDLKEALRFEFGRVGFEIKFNILEAEKVGVPSHRRRVFISNIRIRPKKRRTPTVMEAIGDLIELDESVPNHIPLALSKKAEKKAEKLRWGQALTYFPGAKGVVRNYIKLHPFKPAPTIMGSSRFIHPFELRLLTPREHARLMGFPDDHVFLGPLTSQYNMAGEAVPPPLARAIAEEVKKRL